MRRRRSFRYVALVSAALAGAMGCQTRKQTPAVELPAVRLETSAAAVSGPEASPTTMPATTMQTTTRPATTTQTTTRPTTRPAFGSDAVGVDITWAVIARVPDTALDPLDARATLVSAPLAGGPVLTSGRQTAAARFGDGPAVDKLLDRLRARTDGAVEQVGHQVGVIVGPSENTTFRFIADGADGRQAARSIAISFTQPPAVRWTAAAAAAGGLPYRVPPGFMAYADPPGSIMVTLQGFADTADATSATRPSVTTPETAYLAGLPLQAGRHYALIVPCRFDGSPWRGVVALIDMIDAPVDSGDRVGGSLGRPPATGPSTLPAAERTLRRATDTLRTAKDPRASLLFLATATRATIAADATLVADAPMLDRLRTQVLQFTKDHDAADATALGWHLDRAAVLTLCDAAQAGTLAPELAAVLVLHGGEIGRHADAMAEAVKGVGSAADLNARLVGENTIALEDNSAATRVRAYDWLKAQGRAPADYDPLGDARERRAAINRAISTTQGTR